MNKNPNDSIENEQQSLLSWQVIAMHNDDNKFNVEMSQKEKG